MLVAGIARALVHRLLEPDEAERPQDAAHLDGAGHRVAGIAIGHQRKAVRQIRADPFQQGRLVQDRVATNAELHRGEPGLENPLHVRRPGVLRIHALYVAARRRVDPDTFSDRAAE